MPSSVAGSMLSDGNEMQLTTSYLRERGLLWPLVVLLASFFFAYINVSTPNPFLADALQDKNVTSTSIGMAYAMHPMGIAAAQLFTAQLEHCYGTVKMYSAGFLLAGVSTLLMAFSFDFTTTPTSLAVFVITVRFLQGLGEGITDNAIISMYQLNYHDVVGKVLGFSEAVIGLALAVGPLLGGVLYHVGGFRVPMIIVSVPFFAAAVVGPMLMRDFKVRQCNAPDDYSLGPDTKTPPYSDTVVAIVSLGILLVLFGYGAMTPLFPIYFDEEFGWNEVVVGGIFAGGGVIYFVSGLFCGHYSDQNVKKERPSVYPFLAGLTLSGLSYIAAGPFPGLPFSRSVRKAAILSSVPFASVGKALTIICGTGVMTVAARTHSLASSAFNASLNLGLALGPVFGTFLKDEFGFRWAMAANFFLDLTVVLIAGPVVVLQMNKLNDARAAYRQKQQRVTNYSGSWAAGWGVCSRGRVYAQVGEQGPPMGNDLVIEPYVL